MVPEGKQLVGESRGHLVAAELPHHPQRLLRAHAQRLGEAVEVLLGPPANDRNEEIVEGREVVLHQPGGHAGLGGQDAIGDTRVALRQQQPLDAVEQQITGLGRLGANTPR